MIPYITHKIYYLNSYKYKSISKPNKLFFNSYMECWIDGRRRKEWKKIKNHINLKTATTKYGTVALNYSVLVAG